MKQGEGRTTYLMAEDDPLDVEIVTEMLQSGSRGQIRVKSVDTITAAFEQLSQQHYSALILDLNLPDHQGTNQIGRILTEFPTLPIVILTGLDDEELAIKCLHMGVQDYVSKNQINAELLKRIMRYAVERKEIELDLKQALEEADHQNRQLTKLARTDTLTNLPNRAYFFEVTSQAISTAKRMGKALGILYFDLNGFKFVNDNFGHSVGDQVLIEIAKRMKTRLRNGDTVARVGGDEFVVLTNMLEEPVQAYSVAK